MFKRLNIIFYLLMLAVNYLSVSGKLGGLPIRELSDKYDNLFTPAPLTFSIWSVIYLLLLVFIIMQFGKKIPEDRKRDLLFILSCILNAGWVIVWQYEFIELSVLVMLALLYTLAQLNIRLRQQATGLLKGSFGIYLGWICIATIANITTLLVAWRLIPSVQVQEYITVGLLPVAVWILSSVMYRLKNPFLSLAAGWAFIGIYLKRQGDYPAIAWTAIAAMIGIFFYSFLVYRGKTDTGKAPGV